MHVVLLHNAFYPNAGGIGTSLYYGGQELLKLGYKVSVITAKTSINSSKFEIVDGINVYRYDTIKVPMIDFIFPRLIGKRTLDILCEIVGNEPIDLVVGRSLHTTSALLKFDSTIPLLYFPPNPIGTIIRGWQDKLKESPSFKNIILNTIYSKIVDSFIELEKKIIFDRAKRLACLSQNVADELAKEYRLSADKIEIIQPGVNLERFPIKTGHDTSDLISLTSVKNKKIILYVGRLEEEKNPVHLIKAFQFIQDENVQLVIVGDGSIRTRCELEAKNSNTLFLGHQRDELPELYRCADLFVLPSLVEGFGQTIIESLSSGTPVVALKSNGKEIKTAANEIIGHITYCGLVANTNEKNLADKIIECIGKIDSQTAKVCREAVTERYSWALFAKKISCKNI